MLMGLLSILLIKEPGRGVFDFKEKMFRAGKPEDYITKSTNMNYTPIDKINKTRYKSRTS